MVLYAVITTVAISLSLSIYVNKLSLSLTTCQTLFSLSDLVLRSTIETSEQFILLYGCPYDDKVDTMMIDIAMQFVSQQQAIDIAMSL